MGDCGCQIRLECCQPTGNIRNGGLGIDILIQELVFGSDLKPKVVNTSKTVSTR